MQGSLIVYETIPASTHCGLLQGKNAANLFNFYDNSIYVVAFLCFFMILVIHNKNLLRLLVSQEIRYV